MIFRVSILVVASVAAFAVSPANRKRFKKRIELEKGCKLGDTEMEHSQNLIKELEKRRVTLEGKLLELYGRKEKLAYIACLQSNLDDKTAEIEKLNFRIYALEDEIKDLREIIREGNLDMKQLEMAKKIVEEMQMKNGNASQIKGQIVVLEEQLSGFTANETSARDALVKKTLEAVKNIELRVVKMKRRNKELELEKRELLVKLYAAHAKISALSDMTESEAIAKISELRNANGDLSKEVERLQKSRFDMVEELVYQRWLNACLRAEIQDHQTSSRKTLQTELQKPSDQKPRKITTHYPDKNSTSSSYTSSTESEEIDTSTIESSSSGQRSISKNSGIGHSTIWRSSMDGSTVVSSPDKSSTGSPPERPSIIGRLSTSMVPSKTSMLSTKLEGLSSKKDVPVLKDFTETTEMPNPIKVRRVSFNDAIETVTLAKQVLTKSVEGLLDDKDIDTFISGHRSRMKAGLQPQSALAREKHEFPSSEVPLAKPDQSSDSNRRSADEDGSAAREVSWIANAGPKGLHSCISNVVPENKMDSHMMPPVFAFFLFLFVLVVYLLHLSARRY